MQILIIPTSKNPNSAVLPEHKKKIEKIATGCTIVQTLPGEHDYAVSLSSAEIILTQNLGVIELKNAPNLKWIHMTSAGVNNLTDELKNSEIKITNSSGVHPVPIAEHVLGFMLLLSRNFDQAFRNQLEHQWVRSSVDRPIDELAGKTVCIVGLGQIGERIALLCQSFEMKTLGVVRNPDTKRLHVDQLFGSDGLKKAVQEADYVVNCLPGTPETKHLFDASMFKKFKKGGYFINIGRGTTVNEESLLEALTNGTLLGAGLDVFEVEPLPQSSPLWNLKNVIITPHFSGWSPKSGDRMIEVFCENLRAYLTKEKMPNLVDKELGY